MAGPNIAIYNADNSNLVSIWNVGTVKAQTPSAVFTVNIWNNKGNTTDAVSDLKDCYIGVYDSTGNTANTEVPKNKWVEINVPSVDGNNSTWTAIGGSTIKNIKAAGQTDFSISGDINNGNTTDTSNFCTCSFRINAPINSTPGTKDFNIRLTGYFT